MADFDWSSLAQNLLPAVVGGLMGGRAGGIGAIPGAAYGLSAGVRSGIESEQERARINREIAIKNRQAEQSQQRIDLDTRQQQAQEERYAAERQRWAIQDRAAEQTMKMHDLEMQKMKLQLDEAGISREARESLRQNMSEEERSLFDVDPKSWLERKDRSLKLAGAGQVLGQFGLANGDELAKVLGPQGTAHLLGSIVEARNKPRERYGFHFDSSTGMGFSYDKMTGKVAEQKLTEPKVSAEKRTVIEKSMLDLWKARNGPLAKLAEDSGDWSAYDEWRASPMGRVEAAYRSGGISFEQAQGYRESMGREEKQIDSDALAGMRQTAPNMSEPDFQKYLTTPKGMQNLNAWKQYVRNRGRPETQTAAPAPAKAPEKASAPTTEKKRPSLDDIFGG